MVIFTVFIFHIYLYSYSESKEGREIDGVQVSRWEVGGREVGGRRDWSCQRDRRRCRGKEGKHLEKRYWKVIICKQLWTVIRRQFLQFNIHKIAPWSILSFLQLKSNSLGQWNPVYQWRTKKIGWWNLWAPKLESKYIDMTLSTEFAVLSLKKSQSLIGVVKI